MTMEETPYKKDSSQALWIGDFAEDNDKEHSDQYW
jgi:hypothetical protein